MPASGCHRHGVAVDGCGVGSRQASQASGPVARCPRLHSIASVPWPGDLPAHLRDTWSVSLLYLNTSAGAGDEGVRRDGLAVGSGEHEGQSTCTACAAHGSRSLAPGPQPGAQQVAATAAVTSTGSATTAALTLVGVDHVLHLVHARRPLHLGAQLRRGGRGGGQEGSGSEGVLSLPAAQPAV